MTRLNTNVIVYTIMNVLTLLGMGMLWKWRFCFVILELFLLFLPLIPFKYRKLQSNNLFFFLIATIVGEALLISSTRNIRQFFPSVTLGSEKAIGYIQFYNYPASFDYVYLIMIISVPIVTALVLKRFLNNRYDKS